MPQINSYSNINSINVSSITNGNSIVPSTPTINYTLCREWAIGTGLVENLDYSSKYYAGKSKEYADSILTDTGFIAVSADLTNIDTVATNIANVNTVAGDITNINAVASDLTNIDNVAADLTNIDSVVSNATNINACVSNASNINTVAGNISNVNAVGGSISDVNTVATDLYYIKDASNHIVEIVKVSDNIANVNNVGNNIYDVVSVANNFSNVSTVSSNIGRVNTVANNIGSVIDVGDEINDVHIVSVISSAVSSVAGNATNINTVAGMSSDISSVVSNFTNINTCSTNISDINTCAANIGTINSKVNKTGDTMTGDLIIEKDVPSIICRSPYFDVSASTAPASDLYALSLRSADVNNQLVGQFGIFNNTSNYFIEQMYMQRSVSGTIKGASFLIALSPTGDDFADASAGVKGSITRWSYPSETYDTLTLGASGSTYTAPADGYFYLRRVSDGSYTLASLVNNTRGYIVETSASQGGPSIMLPVVKGDIVAVYWGNGATSNTLRFYYAVGG